MLLACAIDLRVYEEIMDYFHDLAGFLIPNGKIGVAETIPQIDLTDHNYISQPASSAFLLSQTRPAPIKITTIGMMTAWGPYTAVLLAMTIE